ncbi:MAG: type II CAAX endopeptidase family protein [Bacillota bacterium]|nr:type II CAAX endopeptidase family protein [Bacillota bacterium]
MKHTEKKIEYGKGVLIILISIAWLIYQIYLFNNDSQFTLISQRICEVLGHSSQMEWIRGNTVLAYLTSLVPIIHIYLLIILLPRMLGRQFKPFYYISNGIISGILFLLSLMMIPQFVVRIIPELSNVSLQDSVKYWNIIYVNFFLAFGSLFLIILVKILSFIKRTHHILKISELGRSVLRYVLIVILSIFVTLIEASLLALFNQIYPAGVENILRWLTNFAPLITGNIAMLICAPLLEELAFRGFMSKNLDSSMNTIIAILFSSICWGIWHRSIGQFVYIVPFGIVLAYLYKKTNRIRFPILVHFISNFIANCSFLENASAFYKIPGLSIVRDYRLLVFALPVHYILFIIAIGICAIVFVLYIFPKIEIK